MLRVSRFRYSIVNYLSVGIFILAVSCFVMGWQWKPNFISGDIAGPYWLIDNNYTLFECDRLGLICHRIYRSGDFSFMPAELSHHDALANKLSIEVEGEGVIHTYKP